MCQTCRLADRSTEPPWTGYDDDALREAREFFGLTQPVGIYPIPSWEADPTMRGRHHYDEDRGEHVVQLDPTLQVDVADRVLAHELTHAAQAEDEGPMMARHYQFANFAFGYLDNPYEVEARRMADRLEGRFRVMRA